MNPLTNYPPPANSALVLLGLGFKRRGVNFLRGNAHVIVAARLVPCYSLHACTDRRGVKALPRLFGPRLTATRAVVDLPRAKSCRARLPGTLFEENQPRLLLTRHAAVELERRFEWCSLRQIALREQLDSAASDD